MSLVMAGNMEREGELEGEGKKRERERDKKKEEEKKEHLSNIQWPHSLLSKLGYF